MNSSVTSSIHPTALVESGAELGAGVKIGPFCHVGPHVTLGDNVELMSHAVVIGDTTVGEDTTVFPHAVLGALPQNAAHRGGRTKLRIGRGNTIREGVTMHIGTDNARGETIVGDNCMFLAYAHVAHDCILGDHVTFANNVMIGGHTVIGDRVIIGGGGAVHQQCRVGHHAFLGGLAGAMFDVIPYGMVIGNRGHLAGLNIVGMKRSGMAREEIFLVRRVYDVLFSEETGSIRERASMILEEHGDSAAARDIAEFILSDSKRKILTPLSWGRKRTDNDA